jgi:Holliday junction resolvase-like predicted endonuclease
MGLSVERNLLISVLKLTKEGVALTKDVNIDAHIPSNACTFLLQKMQKENLINLKAEKIEVDGQSRLKIAIKAAQLGADLQRIGDLLRWQEFEEIAAEALKINGYAVYNNVRFKHGSRRYEIDVVGCRKPLVVCIDCKRWHHAIVASALRKIVEEQSQRTVALADSFPNAKLKLECGKWDRAKFVPAVLSLMQGAYKFYYEVPIVPVLSLQDFIGQLPLYLEKVKVYPKKFSTLTSNLQDTFL